MSKRNQMPIARFDNKRDVAFPLAFDKWNPDIKAADTSSAEKTINILDPIGYDWWTDSGVTAKSIGNQLNSFGDADIVVNINSPGGDVFEGLAIYNQLREYTGNITVRVLGIAASAASFIAMAADECARAVGMVFRWKSGKWKSKSLVELQERICTLN